MKQKELEAMTPWEQYLAKKKEKRKAKKLKSKNSKKEASEDEGDKPFSDDEIPDGIDLDDPFFRSTTKKNKKKKEKAKNTKSIPKVK
jgi:hypothetical protein